MPFLDTLGVIRKIGGLSKLEIAMFMLPKIRMGKIGPTLEMIKSFRKTLSRIHGRVPRKKFIKESHFKIYQNLYRNDTRKLSATAAKDEVWKKVRNSLDVADATIRHFRYSGLLTVKQPHLTIIESRLNDVDAIIGMKLRPIDFYNDVDKFYAYVGDPDLPKLPFENKDEIISRIRVISESLVEFQRRFPIISPPELLPKMETLPLETLKNELDSLEYLKLEAEQMLQEEKIRYLSRTEIINTYKRIIERDDEIFDPPTYFEWNSLQSTCNFRSAQE